MVSIVTAYHNRKKLFLKTLESIEKSQYKDIEVIVVDDGSSDEHRLEDILPKYPFLKLIRLENKDKWYVNPCVPYNVGFKEAKGDIIIIQNPECYHFHDVISYAVENLKKEDYFSFSCYSLDRDSTENIDSTLTRSFIVNKSITSDGDNGWYNHSLYRPVGYHFCSAIHKENLDDLGGFDERYADGIAFDDNELLVRINKKGLKIKIIDTHTVLHQWHYSSNNYQKVNAQTLIEKNRRLLNEVTMRESGWRVNKNNWLLPEIPKIMNFYWDGSKMSYLQYLTVVSFHKFNPDWQINIYEPTVKFDRKTWSTSEQKMEYVGEDFYPKLKSLDYVNVVKFDFSSIGISENIPEVFKSDLLRWYLLDTIGGGWSDMDILYIKPLNTLKLDGTMLRGTVKSTNTVIVFDGFHHIIGFYLTKPNTGFFKTIFDTSKHSLNPNEYQSVGSRLLMRMYPNMHTLLVRHPNLDISNLPMDIVYSYDDSKIGLLFNSMDDSLITDRTVGIHWYNGSNISKEFNNNYGSRENVITNLIKKLNIE
jgi:GT2 family glycosyltransferase